jgi:biotin carboxyl carrier protein
MKIHVKIQNKTYVVRIGDIHARPIQATVDGETYEVWPEEMTLPAQDYQPPSGSLEKPMKQAAIEEPAPSTEEMVKQVKAPIPGTIISIHVSEGDQVDYGQELCTLEAMKMKNSIRSSRAGKIARVMVKEGDSVKHGQVLMEYDD